MSTESKTITIEELVADEELMDLVAIREEVEGQTGTVQVETTDPDAAKLTVEGSADEIVAAIDERIAEVERALAE